MTGSASSHRFVVLLRGINVGGHNRVPMAELRDALTQSDFSDVATYIQSGNIIVTADDNQSESDVVAAVEKLMVDTFDLTIPVVARPEDQWPSVLADNPFPDRIDEPKLLHVYFCDSAPTQEALAQLDDDKYGADEVSAVGRQLYVFYAVGTARSKLTTNELEKRLGVTTTGRNWSTVNKLHDLLD